jgi:CrcB protein
MAWLAVAIGGALGSVARHGVNLLVLHRWPTVAYPLATLAVNVAGCLIIGLLAGLIAADRLTIRFYWRELVFVGVLGGFTTFSAFGLDTITLLRASPSVALLSVGAQIVLGIGAAYIGFALGAWR